MLITKRRSSGTQQLLRNSLEKNCFCTITNLNIIILIFTYVLEHATRALT